MKRKNWYPLDNAAKIYPPCSNFRRPGNFSLMAVMKEEVNKEILTKAVNNILLRFPTFNVKLKKGVFWYYLEENNKPFIVQPEPPYFMKYIDGSDNNNYLFKVFYSGKKITMVIFHSLSDGAGGLTVFKTLLYEYLVLSGKQILSDDLIKTSYAPSSFEELSDDFLATYERKKLPKAKDKNAFATDGTPFAYDGVGIITGKMKVEELKRVAKEYDATITTFLSALYMQSVYNVLIKGKKVKNKNVTVLVPVNLRKWFPSDTVRNFAMFVRLKHDYEKPITLKECVDSCKKQMEEELTKDKLEAIMHSNVKSEKNWFLKVMPLFVKDFAMRIAYKFVGDNLHTSNLSNLGVVDLPESMKPYVEDIVFALNASFSGKTNVAVISYNGYINITSTRNFTETSIEKEFFRWLAKNGVNIEISSNFWEAKNETL